MIRQIFAGIIAGVLFGLGIALSGMINPAKVISFFDIAGDWDPSLIFVMGGALATAFVGYRVIFGNWSHPVFDTEFHLPDAKAIDTRLISGAAIFGVGWGIAGFCPGGSPPAVLLNPAPTLLFIGSLLAGNVIARLFIAPRFQDTKA
ncbi:DUF6691 family protein [Notoacmeibacter sp. MSK16QG-6]|uniref:DUF6691 family protein n=1 Tax=Notoacmeibacter sp. MSK16QG-6 TaxID=2957982 RepID=UPI00209DDE5D|nr:DUF6691 family protein [Notoacmeibacter sp. MSK16QG-6]MCP1198488.1 YeeE/YedE family protein [Notoacmeibacter sp. MSK16QG-6]